MSGKVSWRGRSVSRHRVRVCGRVDGREREYLIPRECVGVFVGGRGVGEGREGGRRVARTVVRQL